MPDYSQVNERAYLPYLSEAINLPDDSVEKINATFDRLDKHIAHYGPGVWRGDYEPKIVLAR